VKAHKYDFCRNQSASSQKTSNPTQNGHFHRISIEEPLLQTGETKRTSLLQMQTSDHGQASLWKSERSGANILVCKSVKVCISSVYFRPTETCSCESTTDTHYILLVSRFVSTMKQHQLLTPVGQRVLEVDESKWSVQTAPNGLSTLIARPVLGAPLVPVRPAPVFKASASFPFQPFQAAVTTYVTAATPQVVIPGPLSAFQPIQPAVTSLTAAPQVKIPGPLLFFQPIQPAVTSVTAAPQVTIPGPLSAFQPIQAPVTSLTAASQVATPLQEVTSTLHNKASTNKRPTIATGSSDSLATRPAKKPRSANYKAEDVWIKSLNQTVLDQIESDPPMARPITANDMQSPPAATKKRSATISRNDEYPSPQIVVVPMNNVSNTDNSFHPVKEPPTRAVSPDIISAGTGTDIVPCAQERNQDQNKIKLPTGVSRQISHSTEADFVELLSVFDEETDRSTKKRRL
jgi:hypothetical protein